MVAGAVLAALGMLVLTQINADTSFLTHLLPAQVILGLGLGFTFVPLSSLALVGCRTTTPARPARRSTPPSRSVAHWAPHC
ncbi:hypothetical protein NKG94_13565 [Micromonospora sp. M12]